MRRFKNISFVILSVLLLAFSGGSIYKYHVMHRALPEYNGIQKIALLSSKVEVYRDSFAIPHIYAETDSDLYLITGYLTAQDRLWQMDVLRRVTMGRLSEIFGKKLLKTDILMRMLRIPEKSEKILKQTDSAVLKALDSYAKGVNLYIEEHKDNLPPEFAILGYKPEKWKPEHSISLIGYIAWDLNGSWNSEIFLHKAANTLTQEQLNQFIPKTDKQEDVIFSQIHNSEGWRNELSATSSILNEMGLQVFHGSNNWVVSGNRSATGKPILASDMHLGFQVPGIWYQIHQVIKGKLNVTGVLLPGQPFVVSGHNLHIAWGLTNVMNDDIDFYREKINPTDSNSYKFDGTWKKMIIKNETIAIKNEDTVYTSIRFTHRGPVISGMQNVKDETISMHWVGNEMSNEVSSIYYLDRAKNWNDFTQAMKTFVSVSQNVAYADINGNIGMYCCAGIPIRKAGNPADVLPGDTSLYDWAGFVPFEELPHEYNPECNYAISANNRTIGKEYPYYISYWFDLPYRYNRIKQLIEKDSVLSVNDFKVLQTDQESNFVSQYLPKLISTLSKIKPGSGTPEQIVNSLKNWNGSYTSTDFRPAVFEVFYNTFIKNLVKDELGEGLFSSLTSDKIVYRNLFHNIWESDNTDLCDNKTTPQKETFTDLVTQSYLETIATLTELLGDDYKNWQWGDIHTLTLEHPIGKVKIMDNILGLNRGPFPVGGSFHTIAPYSYKYSNLYITTSGASQRHIYSAAGWDDSWSVIPTGNSGIPSSPHYCDQTNLYLEGKYHSDAFTAPTVKSSMKYYKTFNP